MTYFLKRSMWLPLLLTLSACFTVNIYFPAAAVEKAADTIIQDVWQEKPSSQPPAAGQPLSQAAPTLKRTTQYWDPRTALVVLLKAISQPAYAQAPDFNASSPEVSAIKSKIAARFNKLKPLYDSGAVGLTADGYVSLHDASKIPMAQRGAAQQLVNAENADRKALYLAIAKANNQPSWADDIRKIFAQRWISQAQNGWWVQTASGWKQK